MGWPFSHCLSVSHSSSCMAQDSRALLQGQLHPPTGDSEWQRALWVTLETLGQCHRPPAMSACADCRLRVRQMQVGSQRTSQAKAPAAQHPAAAFLGCWV